MNTSSKGWEYHAKNDLSGDAFTRYGMYSKYRTRDKHTECMALSLNISAVARPSLMKISWLLRLSVMEVLRLHGWKRSKQLGHLRSKSGGCDFGIKTAGVLSKTEHKERHMISCLAEKDLVQLDQTEGIWWPTRYSLK